MNIKNKKKINLLEIEKNDMRELRLSHVFVGNFV